MLLTVLLTAPVTNPALAGLAFDVDARLAEHLSGAGSPLVRAAVAAAVRVELA